MFIENLVKEVKLQLKKISGETAFFMEFKEFGDFSTSLPLKLAKKRGVNPKELAEKWASQIKVKGIEIRTEGAFINFFLTKEALIYNLNHLIEFEPIKKIVVIDYSSPNIGKPFSIGHLRSTIIGDSLNKIFSFLGWKVYGINFLGDWGMQFGKLLAAYSEWDSDIEKEPIKELLRLYVKFHEEVEKEKMNPLQNHIQLDKTKKQTVLEEKANEWFIRLEKGDKKAVELWEKFRKLSLKEFNKTYKKLNILELIDAGESKFVDDAKKLVDDLLEKGIAKKDQGAIVIPIEGNPPLILQKSDGTTIYSARDLASGLWRFKKFNPDLMLYVVGSEQKFHFHQLFEALSKSEVTAKMEHNDFGLIRLPEGKMSTRKGRVIFLKDLLNESIEKVKNIMSERGDSDLEIAEKIGIGAVKFADLKNNRTRNIVFNWNMLSFDGETGPYIQYSAIRAKRIIEKFGEGKAGLDDDIISLARKLIKFRFSVLNSAKLRRPDLIANFLIKTSQAFNELYVAKRLGGIPEKEWISKITFTTLQTGLNLLGIDVPEKM